MCMMFSQCNTCSMVIYLTIQYQGECGQCLLRFLSWLLVSFALTIFLSGLTGSELCLFKNLSKTVSQEKIAKFAVSRDFLFVFLSLLSIVFVVCQCRYRMSVSR